MLWIYLHVSIEVLSSKKCHQNILWVNNSDEPMHIRTTDCEAWLFRLKQTVFFQVLENHIEYDFIKKFLTDRYMIGNQTKNCLKFDFSFFLDGGKMLLLYVRVAASFETISKYCCDGFKYRIGARSRGGSRTAATSKMERFVIIVNG